MDLLDTACGTLTLSAAVLGVAGVPQAGAYLNAGQRPGMKTVAMTCPECGAVLDAVTGVAAMQEGSPHQGIAADTQPDEGDLTMCAGCTQILKFGPGGKSLLPLADAEFRALPEDQRALFHRMRRTWNEHRG